MPKQRMAEEKEAGMSKVKLALGAASLFLFIVGLKRTFRMEDDSSPGRDGAAAAGKPNRERVQRGW